MERYEEIEKSIITTYRKKIWCQFIKGVKEFEMVQEGDKIAVCISGGKDSMLLAKCMQELDKIDDHPCYICARMRRGYLYKKAQELGCNKIALGHYFDDVIETIFMGMLYGAQMQTMMPKLHSTYHEGMELIRPLYYVKEADIIKWRERNDLHFIQCACRFTEHCTMCDNGGGGSKREEMKKLLKQLRSIYDKVDMNIYNSTKNVNLNTLISYVKDGEVHHFMDDYDKKKENNSPRE